MNPIRLLLVDDEPFAHKILQGYCRKINAVEVIGSCYDGISTLNFLQEQPVDALLLDIQMPDLTGFELLDSIKDLHLKVIFTTAYSDFALQSFDYEHIVDYLHKPIRLNRFVKAINRLQRLIKLEEASNHLETIPPTSSAVATTTIHLKGDKKIFRIQLKDILYIQSWGNYIKIFLLNGDRKLIRKPLTTIERELPANQFQRIHKSYLINIEHVTAIQGHQIHLTAQTLPIGKSYLMMVKRRLA